MEKTVNHVRESILEMLRESDGKSRPRITVEQALSEQYGRPAVRAGVIDLLKEFIIDLVIDYHPRDSELSNDRPTWFLKLLEPQESRYLRELPPVKRRLLEILYEIDDNDFIGEMPVSKVKELLSTEGFDFEQIKWAQIRNRVERVELTYKGKLTPYFRIIPEYEKSEEYKRAEEEQLKRIIERETRDMALDDL